MTIVIIDEASMSGRSMRVHMLMDGRWSRFAMNLTGELEDVGELGTTWRMWRICGRWSRFAMNLTGELENLGIRERQPAVRDVRNAWSTGSMLGGNTMGDLRERVATCSGGGWDLTGELVLG